MNIDKKIYIIEQLIQEAHSDLRVLLFNETFTKYIEASDLMAIEFLCYNAKQLLQILFVNYDEIQPIQYDTYSILMTKVWDIVELNIEEILQQIEVHFYHLFEILTYKFIPDVQWAQAFKILQLIQKRSQILITESLNANNQLLQNFLPYIYNNSVAQVLLIYFENQFHRQQLEILQIGIQQYSKFDYSSAINFTYLIHEIMVRIQTKELLEYLLSSQVLLIVNDVLSQETFHFIVRKNAAHVISLISNYYSLDLQNLYLDEPYNQPITEEFRKTEFFRYFNIISIKNILEKTLTRSCKVGLLDVKLIEIIDNIVRISDIELWQRVEQSNVMETIINLVKKYNHSDIFIQYVYNMIAFILDRALNDFHPFWCLQLLTKNKLQTLQIKRIDRQLFAFEQQLQIKLIRDSDFLPYYDELKQIESTLKRSQVWKVIKEQIEIHEDKHKFKLGDDLETPQIDTPFIISAIQEDEPDEIIEPQNNIFIDCFNKQSPMDSLNNNDDSDDENKVVGAFQGMDTLNKLKNVFEQMDLQDQDGQDENQKGKKIRNLSNSLNTETQNFKQKLHQRCLEGDNQMSRLSMSTSTHLKKLNVDLEQFTIEIFENKKVLKNKILMKVDEIDEISNQQQN
ncbi:unnamed protein product (macronuclear) [Paramecium tetraurelia]|uniref:FPL domain-containing protein n=1 Tax=Paramecium tetraurelia TaxID=5888 RepID=A0BCL9_PARTE|nr:uncharacterized protein GSPATT00004380001 [Paramecium tetraurelia]CAK56286.1 unnamed protein product [Paramecium tetraurelia]|eukprot:XP_001423684.1 hypothetical protein (macronuclear) [Paramecium tetraurelia strain d4-2]